MRQNSAVKHMQRTPHLHRFTKNLMVNGRDLCDTCPYRVPRWKMPKSLGTKREVYNFEAELLNRTAFEGMTVPNLKELLLKRKPDTKGVSKMRKPDLVNALLAK